MHELGIVFHIADTVTRIAQENRVSHIQAVVLEVGEVSGILEWYLHDCWKWNAKKRPLLEDSVLKVETIPAITRCEDCDKTYSTLEHGRICPYCQSAHTVLLQGQETNIVEIIADHPEDEIEDSETENDQEEQTGKDTKDKTEAAKEELQQ